MEKDNIEVEEIIECGYCWDKRKKRSFELFFLDRANNIRLCEYCPICGRKL